VKYSGLFILLNQRGRADVIQGAEFAFGFGSGADGAAVLDDAVGEFEPLAFWEQFH